MSFQHDLTTHWVVVWQDTMRLPFSSLLKQDELLARDASADDRSLSLYGHKLEIFHLCPVSTCSCTVEKLGNWIKCLYDIPLWLSFLWPPNRTCSGGSRPFARDLSPAAAGQVARRWLSCGLMPVLLHSLSLFPLLTFPCILFLLTGLFGAPTRRGFVYSIWYSICVPRIMVIFPCIFVYSPNCCVCSVNQDSFFIILFIPDCHGERGWKEHSKENISAISGTATHGHGLQVSTHTI